MITVTGLQKIYDEFTAVDQISFEIKQGELFGLLGPNGAGKTTTLRMICGLLQPTHGEVMINGFSVQKESQKIKPLLSVVFDCENVYEDLTARENLLFSANLYRLNTSEAKKRVEELLEMFNLADRKELVKKFSKGMKQRLNIARALLPEPKILILDEPTNGLDPQSTVLVRDLLLNLKKKGTTILLTSHNIDEVEKVVDTVAIIDHGQLISYGSYADLYKKYSEDQKFEIETLGMDQLERWIPKEVAILQEKTGTKATFYVKHLQKFLYHLGEVMEQGVFVTNIQQKQLSLEDIFIQLTGRELRD